MSASFAGASSQYLSNSASPITAVPFTVALICRTDLVDAAVHEWVTFTDTGAANTRFCIRQNTSDAITCQSVAAGTARTATGPTAVAGQTYLVIARFVSSTNRWVHVLDLGSGAVTHAQNTQSSTPTGIDTIGLGATLSSGAAANFLTGRISEFWYCDIDIWPGGGQLEDWVMWRLALYGPFSIPHIQANLVEYRSFWKLITQDAPGEVYWRGTQPNWSNVNGVTLGVHPSLPGYYRRPSGMMWRQKQGLLFQHVASPASSFVWRQFVVNQP